MFPTKIQKTSIEKLKISLIFPEIMSCYYQYKNPKDISRPNDPETSLV